MVAAIEIYNKPVFAYREETFAVLAINAWELLIKAKWLREHQNKLTSLYVKESGKEPASATNPSARSRYKQNRTGNPMTHSLEHLVQGLVASKFLDVEVLNNLQGMIAIRDNAIHFYNESPLLAQRLQELGTATVKNFVIASQDWFGMDFADYNFHLMPLAFFNPPAVAAVVLTKEEKRIVQYIESLETNKDSARNYAVSVNVEVKFIRSKASDSLNVQLSNDPAAMPIQFTEEQITAKYPIDFGQLRDRCAKRYRDFVANAKFYSLKKSLQEDQKYSRERELDVGNPRTPKKRYYSEAIFTELDKHYEKK